MRGHVKDFVKRVAAIHPGLSVIEFGSMQVHENSSADLRPLFPGREFLGTDMREGKGVDKVLNLHNIDLPDSTYDIAICVDTLEHVEYPHKALEEMERILKPGGIAIIASVMLFPIHDYPGDYFRYTPEGFGVLLKPFHKQVVGQAGLDLYPHTVAGVGLKKGCEGYEKYVKLVQEWSLHTTKITDKRGKRRKT